MLTAGLIVMNVALEAVDFDDTVEWCRHAEECSPAPPKTRARGFFAWMPLVTGSRFHLFIMP